MTEFISKQNLQGILANKMAEFSNAMTMIQRAETEAIFADITAKRSEQRMNEFISMVSGWENIKAQGQMVSNHMSMSMIDAAINKINNLMYKVSSLQAKKESLENKSRQYAFQLLDMTTQQMQGALDKINEKLESGDMDPMYCQVLLQKKQKIEASLQKAEEIKKIKDNKEAMKAFQSFAEEVFLENYPNNGQYTQEELRTKLNTVKPEGDSVLDYFKSIKGIFELYKEGMNSMSEQITQSAENYTQKTEELNKKEAEIKAQQEQIKAKEDAISEKLSSYGITALKIGSAVAQTGILGLPLQLAATAGNAIADILTTNQEQAAQNTNDNATAKELTPEQQAEVQKLQEERDALTDQRLQYDQALAALTDERAQIEAQAKMIDLAAQRFEKMQQMFDSVEQTFEEAEAQIQQMSDEMKNIEDKQKDIKVSETEAITQLRSESMSEIAKVEQQLNETKREIILNKKDLTIMNNEINELNDDLKTSEMKENQKKLEAAKEAEFAKFKVQHDDNDKNELVNKLTKYIKNTTDNQTKVVIDRSLSDIYSDLASNFDDNRVVVDKRTGSRRTGEDRRAVEQQEKETRSDDNNFLAQRSDVAGRRKGDRREGKHIFISEDTVKKLNIQS